MEGNSFDQMWMEVDPSGSQTSADNLNWLDVFKGNVAAETPMTMASLPQESSSESAERKSLTTRMEPADKKIEWHKDVFKAYDQAVLERKPLIVKFETDWCDYCKDLNDKVLTDTRFLNLADKAVFVAANPEKDKVAADLGKQLGVDGYPTVVVMEARPELLQEVGRVVGLLPADKFMPQLQKLMPLDPAAHDRKEYSV